MSKRPKAKQKPKVGLLGPATTKARAATPGTRATTDKEQQNKETPTTKTPKATLTIPPTATNGMNDCVTGKKRGTLFSAAPQTVAPAKASAGNGKCSTVAPPPSKRAKSASKTAGKAISSKHQAAHGKGVEGRRHGEGDEGQAGEVGSQAQDGVWKKHRKKGCGKRSLSATVRFTTSSSLPYACL
jgi:hypothetical protein